MLRRGGGTRKDYLENSILEAWGGSKKKDFTVKDLNDALVKDKRFHSKKGG